MERSTLAEEPPLMTQHNLNRPPLPPAPRLARASVFSTAYANRPNPHAAINTIRYPPRIPRLRRPPQAFVSHGMTTEERPSSISSAVSMTRNVVRREPGSSLDPDNYHRIGSAEEDDVILNNSLYDLHCVSDEKAVDLAHMCNVDIQKMPSNTSYVALEFGVVSEDGGQYSSTYSVHNILKNDGTVYCSERCGTINILLRYRGWEGMKNQRSRYCVLSHIVIKSPTHGYTAPCKEGMIFMSHKPIDIESTRAFDLFTKDNFERYTHMNHDNLDDTDPIAWFSATDQRQCVVDMQEKSGKYVLIKLLRADYESENMDLQYIGFVGYTGSRCFAKAKIC
ncbi:hypothetical protein V8B55DRAFT_1038382 [Mucor lusitanicus]|uniref:Uncharacterized protein n=1 Tax=Mucor lusitanicus CBS 277.49 TaxID=747725 RepID=A0A168PFI4_MUCCL|nr:hypothetical protein MUCCIDRAFT_77387 [Mucor lusitanicus CBS 277.49]